MSGSLFAAPAKAIDPYPKATFDQLRQMAADMAGFHYRHAESWALLRRLVAADPVRWPAGIDGLVEAELDDGWWWLFWNGTAETVPIPARFAEPAPPWPTWPRHCWTTIRGMPHGYWSDTAGWQINETRWLRALRAHVEARERQSQQRET